MKNEQRISEIVDEILAKERTLTAEPISIPIVLKRELPKYVQPKTESIAESKQRRIKMGKGEIEVCVGYQDGVPTLNFIPHKKQFKIGEQTRDAPCKITDEYLTEREAIVIEFPGYKGVDVILFEIMELWECAKVLEWDGIDKLKKRAEDFTIKEQENER